MLSRKNSEQLVIGRDIVITVSSIRADRVQLAIDAPSSVRVRRGELRSKESSSGSQQSGKHSGEASA
ncbi:MAG: carbon storage regulator [Pirellulaceae bacterium]